MCMSDGVCIPCVTAAPPEPPVSSALHRLGGFGRVLAHRPDLLDNDHGHAPAGEEAKHRRDRHDDHLDVEDRQQQWVVRPVVGVAKLRHVGPQHNPQDAQRYIEDWRRERREDGSIEACT